MGSNSWLKRHRSAGSIQDFMSLCRSGSQTSDSNISHSLGRIRFSSAKHSSATRMHSHGSQGSVPAVCGSNSRGTSVAAVIPMRSRKFNGRASKEVCVIMPDCNIGIECPADYDCDCDGDSVLDFFDISLFLSEFTEPATIPRFQYREQGVFLCSPIEKRPKIS